MKKTALAVLALAAVLACGFFALREKEETVPMPQVEAQSDGRGSELPEQPVPMLPEAPKEELSTAEQVQEDITLPEDSLTVASPSETPEKAETPETPIVVTEEPLPPITQEQAEAELQQQWSDFLEQSGGMGMELPLDPL